MFTPLQLDQILVAIKRLKATNVELENDLATYAATIKHRDATIAALKAEIVALKVALDWA